MQFVAVSKSDVFSMISRKQMEKWYFFGVLTDTDKINDLAERFGLNRIDLCGKDMLYETQDFRTEEAARQHMIKHYDYFGRENPPLKTYFYVCAYKEGRFRLENT